MSPNSSGSHGGMPSAHFTDETQDLADLVDDAAKALSIGGSRQAASEVREAVSSLKHQLGHDAAVE